MTTGLADTSVFIAAGSGRSAHLDRLPDRLAVSVITVSELRAGVLAADDVTSRDRPVVNHEIKTVEGRKPLHDDA